MNQHPANEANDQQADARARRTREALFSAFSELVLSRPYEDIRINDIIEQAGIARSTFYQHYQNKDDILAGSMQGMLQVLAGAATGTARHADLTFILEHFWENRRFGRIILNSPAYKRIVKELAQLIEQHWQLNGNLPGSPIPAGLQAMHLAEGQFGLLRAWLSGSIKCFGHDLASHLLSSGKA